MRMRIGQSIISSLMVIYFCSVSTVRAGQAENHDSDPNALDALLSAIDSATMTPVEKAIHYVQQANLPTPDNTRDPSLERLADILTKAQKNAGLPKGCKLTKIEYHAGDFDSGERLFISVDNGVNPPVSIKLGGKAKAFLPAGYASYPLKEKLYTLSFGNKVEQLYLSDDDVKQVSKASEKIRAGASFCYLRNVSAEVKANVTTQEIECNYNVYGDKPPQENDPGTDSFYIAIAQNNQNHDDIKIAYLLIKKTKFVKLPAGNLDEATVEKTVCGIPEAILETIGVRPDATGSGNNSQKSPVKKPTKNR